MAFQYEAHAAVNIGNIDKVCNAVVGRHVRSRRARSARLLDCVAPLGNMLDITGEARLAKNLAGRAEFQRINVIGH